MRTIEFCIALQTVAYRCLISIALVIEQIWRLVQMVKHDFEAKELVYLYHAFSLSDLVVSAH
jgi:hypothetical protein